MQKAAVMEHNPDYHLRRWGDPVLRERCAEVEDFSYDSGLEALLSAMYSIKGKHGGIGMSAPQVGDARRVVLADVYGWTREFINPAITARSGHRLSLEGCLSIRLLRLPKLRSSSIELTYQDRQGVSHSGVFTGMDATVLQHELDHLDGRLIVDYL